MHLDFNDGTPKIMYKTTSRVRKFTKQRVFFIFKAGADCVKWLNQASSLV